MLFRSEQSPQIVDGIWKQIWLVVDKTEAELEFERKLAESYLPEYQRNR